MKERIVPVELELIHDKLLDGLEFCRLTYEIFENVASESNGGHVLRERRGYIKQLIEELLPLCRYIQTFYGPGRYISIRWTYGSQSFDAKFEAKGVAVDHGMWPKNGTIEITQAAHKNDYLMRQLLNEEGGGFGMEGISVVKEKGGLRKIISEPTSYHNQSYINDMAKIILDIVNAKINKLRKGVYPSDTTLIVGCSLFTVFFPSEWQKLIELVKIDLPKNDFAHIFLTDNEGYHSSNIKKI